MAKIAVFDSGLGSLSIIKALQKNTKCEIIYFADHKSFPYGNKSKSELAKIIQKTIKEIREKFGPDFIIIGSNTPSIILNIRSKNTFKVLPPLKQAVKISKTKNIAILATKAAVASRELSHYVIKMKLPKNTNVYKINCSKLVDLVESGDFLNDKDKTKKTINETLAKIIEDKKIDAATLSSTHLPFLENYLARQFPGVRFLDPADNIAKNISKRIKPMTKNRLRIYVTGKNETFENNLKKLKIKNKVISF